MTATYGINQEGLDLLKLQSRLAEAEKLIEQIETCANSQYNPYTRLRDIKNKIQAYKKGE